VDSLGKLPDEDLESVDAHARAQDEEHVRAQGEIVLYDGADEVRLGVLFTVQHDVGAELADPECSLPSLLPSGGGSSAVWAGRLSSC
jgi:hypothetical protein